MSFGSHMFHPRFLNTLTYSLGMVAVYWVARIDMFMRLPIAVFFLKSAVDMLVMYDL